MKRISPALLIPPILAVIVAGAAVRNQTSRHEKIVGDLQAAKREVSRLEKLLPEGERAPKHSAEDCKDEHHAHGG